MTKEDNSDDDDDVTEETRCQMISRLALKAIRQFIAFLFSHVGLTCLVAAYTFLGGLLFKAVEYPREQEVRDYMTGTKETMLNKIVGVSTGPDELLTVNKPEWNTRVEQVLKDFEREIQKATEERNWDGAFGDEEYQWSFANSLLYSVTVITTIGYGNITPKTTLGRILTIAYGIFGIPITMLCLRNIGNLLAGIFRLIYRVACVNVTYQYIRLKRKRLRKRFTKRLQQKTKTFRHWANRKQSMMTSLIHAKIGNSRNGSIVSTQNSHGEAELWKAEMNVPKEESSIQMIGIDIYESCDNAASAAADDCDDEHTSIFASNQTTENALHDACVIGCSCRAVACSCRLSAGDKLSDEPRQRSQSLSAHVAPSPRRQVRKPSMLTSGCHCRNEISHLARVDGHRHYTSDLCIIPEDSVDEIHFDTIKEVSETNTEPSSSLSTLCLNDFKEDELLLKARLKSTRDLVPISVCLLLVTGYIISGAIILTPWEDNWDFLVGFYFCFITLTTIGFGDFVPGMGSNWDSDGKRIFCVAYLLLGMALLAMCFHLIQEEVRHKCRKMAVRIGLIEEKLTQMLDTYTNRD